VDLSRVLRHKGSNLQLGLDQLAQGDFELDSIRHGHDATAFPWMAGKDDLTWESSQRGRLPMWMAGAGNDPRWTMAFNVRGVMPSWAQIKSVLTYAGICPELGSSIRGPFK
jgi:hypothetical protein